MRLHSALRGTSTDVEMRSRIVMRASISLRIDSIEPCWRRKRLARALSSRIKPSSKCSVSMYGLPYWLASYLAKKMTRRAFSVYRSNTLNLLLPLGYPSQASQPRQDSELRGSESTYGHHTRQAPGCASR